MASRPWLFQVFESAFSRGFGYPTPSAPKDQMDHPTAFRLPRHDQSGSCLFNGIPGEVRDKIFTFALNCYENPQKLWDKDTPYVRPGHAAAQVADVALLRTCQRVYTENWFRPWISATHTFYLASPGRRPDQDAITTIGQFQPRLDRLFAAHGVVEISHVQVFAQMYLLEPNNSMLTPFLTMDHFFPKKLTVTIRHHDWWWWEDDHRLKIDASWIQVCRFPDSLKEVCIELESLQRKKNQIDWIAGGMVKHWHLEKVDGTIMSADNEDCRVSSWSGSSTWEGERWIRDETKPSTIEYYVKTVTWRPNKEMTTRPRPPNLSVPNSFPVVSGSRAYIPVSLLEEADIPAGLTAAETLHRIEAWEAANASDWNNVGDDFGDIEVDDIDYDVSDEDEDEE